MMEFGDKKLRNPKQAFANFVEEKRLREKRERGEFIEKKRGLEVQKEYLAGGYSEEETLRLAESAKAEVVRLEGKYGSRRKELADGIESGQLDSSKFDSRKLGSKQLDSRKLDSKNLNSSEKIAS